jgi:hypothetical protein
MCQGWSPSAKTLAELKARPAAASAETNVVVFT